MRVTVVTYQIFVPYKVTFNHSVEQVVSYSRSNTLEKNHETTLVVAERKEVNSFVSSYGNDTHATVGVAYSYHGLP